MFLPATPDEVARRGWERLDVVIVTGDAYVDAPQFGAAVIGRVLEDAGYRVGIIAQPDIDSPRDITRFGEPALFWGVTAGAVDSIISNYTATGKRRNRDDLTPGGVNDRRPDRASIAYANLIRRYFKNTAPIVLGGVEASLRRVAHYDARDNALRRSILFDAKADYLAYGMAERTVLHLASAIKNGCDTRDIPGLCHIAKQVPEGYIELPGFESCLSDKDAFIAMHRLLAENMDSRSARGLVQRHGDRYLVHNPPPIDVSPEDLDAIHELGYEREAHPLCRARGEVRALDTVRFSITTHRGCFGGCSFCAIAIHQGRRIVSRSIESIVREARSFLGHPSFAGIISDVGGPTANMYGMSCANDDAPVCAERQCAGISVCRTLVCTHERSIALLRAVRSVPGIRKVFVASGVRHDLVLADHEFGRVYLEELVEHHVSGQLKVAPEHSEPAVLRLMGKPDFDSLREFKQLFDDIVRAKQVPHYLTYYFIAAHPGSTDAHMRALHGKISRELRITPEQVQIFTPSPSTVATLMYYTGVNPSNGAAVFVERDRSRRERQKRIITG